jgi:acetyltransferase-like isoleucine patch superfamily enzyme
MMRRFFRLLVPNRLRHSIRLSIRSMKRNFKAPRMVWGHMDASGIWQEKTRISDTVYFYHKENINISNNIFVWHYTIIDGTGGVDIGEGSQIGAWVGIFTHSSHIAIRIYGNHYQEIPESEKKGFLVKSVTIGKYVFVGAGSIIFPGVKIGDGALISAGSYVTRDVKPFEIVSGNPANVVGDTRKLDKRFLRDPTLNSWYEEWQKT